MTEHKNLPTQLTNQALVNSTKGKHSLIGRGMNALINIDNDAIYRQARKIYNEITDNGVNTWGGAEERKAPMTQAFKVFQSLAGKGYGKAFFPLSTIYNGEQSIEGDPVKAQYFHKLAFDWLQKNEHLNDPEIWCDLGVLYMHDDNQLVAHYFQKGADVGDPSCMWMLCGAYEYGLGVEENFDKALHWQIKAAMGGHSRAQHGLEIQQDRGDLDIDDEQVFDWYVWSAEQGYVWAQVLLADIHFDGHIITGEGFEGIEEFCSRWYNEEQTIYWYEEKQAAYWYEKAANSGDTHAQLQLGKMYWHGLSCIRCDEKKARYWLLECTEQGAPEALYQLGLFLRDMDEEEQSLSLIQSAADQNYGPAQYEIVKNKYLFEIDEVELAVLFDKAMSWYEEHLEFNNSFELQFEHALIHLDNWDTNHNILGRAWHPKGLKLLTEIVIEPIMVSMDTFKPLPNLIQLLALARLESEILICPNKKYTAEAKHCWTMVMEELQKQDEE